ncbi:hypothetical protein [Pelagovum sp. HNIBRBA483]|uniref:hypothetical protein n=1 Tax=Pelagovum sp. HNIBRBA483 TaxID=3233341 RepID=UPI0034A28E43
MTRKTHTNLTNLDLMMLSGGMETMPQKEARLLAQIGTPIRCGACRAIAAMCGATARALSHVALRLDALAARFAARAVPNAA